MNTIEQEINGINEDANIETEELQQRNISMPSLEFLKVETGEGPIELYIEHPLNFSKSKGLARIIRGLTGWFGALNLAIIDVVIGLLEFTKERKKAGDTVVD